MDKIQFFTHDQGNFLIRLLIAHIAADFIFQTNDMVKNKKWFSKEMGIHILVVFLTAYGLSLSYIMATIIAITHWLIDGIKIELQEKKKYNNYILFGLDQAIHILIILFIWAYSFSLFESLYDAFKTYFFNYNFNLLAIGYAIVIWPMGYLIKFSLQKMIPEGDPENIEHGGKLIGQFERIIILTFVILGEYEAIGFLITGKSIIRFADSNKKIKSEYVLVGTMMSYALSILTGLAINWLLKI